MTAARRPYSLANARLFDELEREARVESRRLENALRLPFGFTEAEYPLTDGELRELRWGWAAFMLADSAETFCALYRREAVPRHRLRVEYLHLLERWPS